MLINCKLSFNEGSSGKSKASKQKPGSLTVTRIREEALRLTLNFGGTNKKANKVYLLNKDNITNVFNKFVDKGKLTIVLSPPSVQIFVSDVTNSKTLLKLSHIILDLKNSGRLAPESDSDRSKPVAAVTDLRTRVEIKNKDEYGANKEFGPFIEFLSIQTKMLKSVDLRWFNLQRLTTLDLSENNLGAMDSFGWLKFENIRKLTRLLILNLSNNNLKILSFKFVSALPKGLAHLYLSDNKIDRLPDNLCELSNLITLNVARNLTLSTLPDDFFKFCRRLQNLNCSNTNIKYHDAEIRNLRLTNLASTAIGAPAGRIPLIRGLPTLYAIACAAVYDHKFARDTLPLTIRSEMRRELIRCNDCGKLYPRRYRKACYLQPLLCSHIADNVEFEMPSRPMIILLHNICIACYSTFTRNMSNNQLNG